MLETVGDRVYFARSLVRALSARELGQLADLSDTIVGIIERGDREEPNIKTIAGIAGVLGCSIDWLITGTGEAPAAASVHAAVDAARAKREAKKGAA